MTQTNIDNLRKYYIDIISNCKTDAFRVIISKNEIQYIIDIISVFKFKSEPYELGSDLLLLDIFVN